MADITITGPIIPSSLNNCETRFAQVAIAAGKVVYADETNGGKWNLADADALASSYAVGIAVNTAAAGEPCTVAKNGSTITQAGTTFTKGATAYASVTAGSMADSLPASTKFSTTLGVALSTSQFLVGIVASGVAVA